MLCEFGNVLSDNSVFENIVDGSFSWQLEPFVLGAYGGQGKEALVGGDDVSAFAVQVDTSILRDVPQDLRWY